MTNGQSVDRSSAAARRLAERAHGDLREPNGSLILDHVRRVATTVPPFARRVAWLHDALEWAGLRDEDLRAAGLDAEEIAAVQLLTREEGGDDDGAFLAHVAAIARASGRAGGIVRAVKRADMVDRCRNPRDPDADWIPPYERGLALLAEADRTTAATAATDAPRGHHRGR